MSQVTRYRCPIGACGWFHDDQGPSVLIDSDPEALTISHAKAIDDIVRAHLETHSLEEWAQEIGRLRERLTAAEEVCLVFGWTGANLGTDRDKALHELWRHWCDVSGASLSPADHPELNQRRLARLAAKRDETRARTLAAIRERDGNAP